MQIKKLLLVAIILFSCSSNKTQYHWEGITYEDALNSNTDKIILIDFYSDT